MILAAFAGVGKTTFAKLYQLKVVNEVFNGFI